MVNPLELLQSLVFFFKAKRRFPWCFFFRNWPLGGDPSDAGRKWWALLLTSTTLFYCVLEMIFLGVDIGTNHHQSMGWLKLHGNMFCFCVRTFEKITFKNVILTRCLWINAWYHVVEISSKSMLKYLVICKKFHPRRIPATYHVRRRHRGSASSPLRLVTFTMPNGFLYLSYDQVEMIGNSTRVLEQLTLSFFPPCFFTVTRFFACQMWRSWWKFVLGFVDMGSLLHNSAWIGIALTLFCTLPWRKLQQCDGCHPKKSWKVTLSKHCCRWIYWRSLNKT